MTTMADQIKYPTLATLLQQHPGNVNYARIYESVDYDTPLLDRIPSEVIPGTSKQELISISIPLIGAVPYNAGTQTFRTDYKTVNAETHPYQGMIALDKKLVHANQAAAGQMMEREIRSGMRGIKANLERSLFYGKKISPYGMEGLVDQIGDYMTISASGSNTSRVHGGASVWMLSLSEDTMHMLWGNSRSIQFGPQTESLIPQKTAEGKEGFMKAFTRDVDFSAGFQLLDDCAAVRLVNVTEDQPLTDELLSRMVEVFPEGRDPNLIITNRLARYTLRLYRQSKYSYVQGVSGQAADAHTPTDYEGIPIYTSSALLRDETEANLKALAAVNAIKNERDTTNLKR